MTDRDAFIDELERFLDTQEDHLDKQTRREILSAMVNVFAFNQRAKVKRKERAASAVFWLGVLGVPISLVINLDRFWEVIGWGG